MKNKKVVTYTRLRTNTIKKLDKMTRITGISKGDLIDFAFGKLEDLPNNAKEARDYFQNARETSARCAS